MNDLNDLITADTIFNGRLRVKQPRQGYRYSVDAPLLVHFVGPLSTETVLDLGTGCGIIPLILACRFPKIAVHGVELQSALAEIADRNVQDNGLADRVRVHAMDMKEVTPGLTSGPVDLVVCNPPFYPVDSGRLNPDSQRALARHEIEVTLSGLIETAARMLRDGGRFAAVYPAGRLADMLLEMRRGGLEPRILRLVHPKEKGPAKLFLVEGIKGDRRLLEILPPLVIYNKSGDYTEEVTTMFQL